MHEDRFNDPLISEPAPIALLLPVLERSLASVGIAVTRDELIDRFMAHRPRLAVLAGSPDHPAQLADREGAAQAVGAIWNEGGLPFEVVEPAICAGIAHGHPGMSYTLAARNVTTAAAAAVFEAHGYHAALVFASGDARPVGDLAALIEVDRARRRTGRPPLYATFLPAHVMPERPLPEAVRAELAALRDGTTDSGLRGEIDALLTYCLKANTYVMLTKLLANLRARGSLDEARQDRLERELAKAACEGGGGGAFLGPESTDPLILAALGLVPRGLECRPAPATAAEIARAVQGLVRLLEAGDPTLSVSALTEANLPNALTIWSGIGGSVGWVLHFPYLAAFLDISLTPSYIAAVSRNTPQLLEIGPGPDQGLFAFALETREAIASGIDTILKAFWDLGLVKDAPTVDGRWAERVAEAKPPSGRVVRAEPLRPTSGIVELRGNFCESTILQVSGLPREGAAEAGPEVDPLEPYDKRIYVAVAYLGEAEARRDLLDGRRVLERLRGALTPAELRQVAQWNESAQDPRLEAALAGPSDQLLDRLVRERLLRILVVIVGEGPRANGIPEMYYPAEYVSRDPLLRPITALLTDGRYAGAAAGRCIGHCFPEALEGGGICGIITGDLIYLDFGEGRIELLDKVKTLSNVRKRTVARMIKRDIVKRPIINSRLTALAQRREEIPYSLRSIFDSIEPAPEGCVPKGLKPSRPMGLVVEGLEEPVEEAGEEGEGGEEAPAEAPAAEAAAAEGTGGEER
jgi:dihydroxyacid dehydratase/phosphogluconate dehydratase